jgi:hypothetical protein
MEPIPRPSYHLSRIICEGSVDFSHRRASGPALYRKLVYGQQARDCSLRGSPTIRYNVEICFILFPKSTSYFMLSTPDLVVLKLSLRGNEEYLQISMYIQIFLPQNLENSLFLRAITQHFVRFARLSNTTV